ncbi:MAG: hypothetical protein Q7J46_14590 [Pseudomonas sp.]|jgi:hypothetical protein|nr:hypothetical protein [Pseudomonas sp.]
MYSQEKRRFRILGKRRFSLREQPCAVDGSFVTTPQVDTCQGFPHLATVYDRAHPRAKRKGSSE